MDESIQKLMIHEKYRQLLIRALELQKEKDSWEWYEVHAPPQTLNHLVSLGVLNVVFKSNKSTMYAVAEPEKIRQMLEEGVQQAEVHSEIPEDLFDCVILHDDKKALVRRVLSSTRPTHCLFVGEVASSKTLFMEELSRLPGSQYLLGSSLSKAGLYELMFEHHPRYLLIDEIDKIRDYDNVSALLSLMETGILSETKYKRRRFEKFDVWVFGGCNFEDRIPPEILSRFGAYRLRFYPYTDDEFIEVATKVLVMREGTDIDVANYIAVKVLKTLGSRDVRVARSIARTTRSREDVDTVLALLQKQVK